MASTSQASGFNGTLPVRLDPPPALAEKPAGLPPGKYKLVGWDLVTTGTRLVDEMCQVAAYIPPQIQYSQYIMPYGDLRPAARRRHNIRVVTVGRYRMLKEQSTQKVLKTKLEVSALADFMNWLESVKSKDELIILIYHEPRRMSPMALIQGLIRHNQLARFETIVAGFTDSYALCADKCRGTFKSVSLRMLAKLLLEKGSQRVDTSIQRAIATYKIVELLANQACELQDLGAGGEGADSSPTREMVELACEFARPVSTEVEALENLKDLLHRQNTFRAVFTPLLCCSRQDRRRLTQLRRVLAEAGLLYDQLKDAWHEGRRAGLANVMSPLEQIVTEDDIQELVNIFDCHFDPAKGPHYPPSRVPRPRQQVRVEEPYQLYLSSDSDSSGQLSSSLSVSGLAAAFLMVEEDIYLDF